MHTSKPVTVPQLALVVSVMSVALGCVGGIIGTVATNSRWQGQVETRLDGLYKRVDQLEADRNSDRITVNQTLDYVRTQNEVINRDIGWIKGHIEGGRRSNALRDR